MTDRSYGPSKQPFGLLVMAYGTPTSLSEVEPYYTHIRRGRPPSPEQLADLTSRYEAIGGVSPLAAVTRWQAEGIAHIINSDGGRPCRLYLGMKHASPFIEDAVSAMYKDGIEEAVTLVLAPHYSSMSVGVYQTNAADAAAKWGGPRLTHIDSWHLQPRFLDVLGQRVKDAVGQFDDPAEVTVIFSAHSLPERILELGDPYPSQLHATGDEIARRLALPRHTFAWQSAGRTPEPWLGPDILDVIQDLARDGHGQLVVCPAGFVSDHLEVLYDIDIEAQQVASSVEAALVRTESLNADPEFLTALAEVVRGVVR